MEMATTLSPMREFLARTPVMPVLTIRDAAVAGDLAHALVDGGIDVFEVLMRTPAAADAIAAMAKAEPKARVGAGTLLTPADVARAVDAGASFGVAPGLTETLGRTVRERRLPFLPGVATASEIMSALELGFEELKFFPAHGAAAVTWLKSVAGVFPGVTFCPTGGILAEHVAGYISLPNCTTIGCSWVAPADLVAAHDWKAITARAARAAAMRRA
jgi:2-dehydro-3-deoxyphosphogluconate aldolase/(4S)-4-hydroxy-2-oxoglutarate aldolase